MTRPVVKGVVVRGCVDCPFSVLRGRPYCNADESVEMPTTKSGGIADSVPAGCPLWKGPITVSIDPPLVEEAEDETMEKLSVNFRAYLDGAEEDARRVFEEKVLPFVRSRGWHFLAANGTFLIRNPKSRPGGQSIYANDHQEDEELQRIWGLLSEEVPGLPSKNRLGISVNRLGSLMPTWEGDA